MAAEEFQESDVFFSGDHREVADLHHNHHHHRHRRQRSRNNKKQKKSAAPSVPVDIPTNVFRFGDSDEYEEDEEEEEGSIIPPHVILARRVAGKMAFSVCTGNGRTLKGRDLSQVRNSILRMTGFLET
ncbi:unnamed protein product [Linum tenue]|uniref:Senescence regulator n=1 Tax=Linum tenue TaxID=586396 RepID=A0AAV0RT22_9ROSI|nr:unnamed protein product [Linum tenue]